MLEEYKKKRNFKITPEPAGSTSKAKKEKNKKKNSLTFVIQKHAATALHYDFRLEVDGVMVSWAVPKGPSLNPADRRLAVMTEDHPMEYSSFEGIIPEKQYGAGEVIIWDEGIYSPDKDKDYSWDDKADANRRMREGLRKGKLSFYLKGSKLEGSWALIKWGRKERDWFLIKHHDRFETSDVDITKQNASVVSGKTIEDLQEHGATKIWTRDKGAQKADPKTTGKSWKTAKKSSAKLSLAHSQSDSKHKPKANIKQDHQILTEDAKLVIEQLKSAKGEKCTLEFDSTILPISSLNKIYWPETDSHNAITKRDYLIYLASVSGCMLPHLKDRLLTLRRFPNGIEHSRFYQKHWEQKLPPFVQTAQVFTEKSGTDLDFIACNNLATLLWLGQIADLEIHTSHTLITNWPDARKISPDMTGSVEALEKSIGNYPDLMVLDLDPYMYSGNEKAGAEPELHKEGFEKCPEIILYLKAKLDALGLSNYVKTSGKTGLHIYVPIKRNVDYDTLRNMSEIICREILKEHPDEVTMEWSVKNRTGRIFLDHNMNARSKSLASPYSPRITPGAHISTPLEWQELDSVYPTDFTMQTIPQRLAAKGDVWADMFQNKNDLIEIFGKSLKRKR